MKPLIAILALTSTIAFGQINSLKHKYLGKATAYKHWMNKDIEKVEDVVFGIDFSNIEINKASPIKIRLYRDEYRTDCDATVFIPYDNEDYGTIDITLKPKNPNACRVFRLIWPVKAYFHKTVQGLLVIGSRDSLWLYRYDNE